MYAIWASHDASATPATQSHNQRSCRTIMGPSAVRSPIISMDSVYSIPSTTLEQRQPIVLWTGNGGNNTMLAPAVKHSRPGLALAIMCFVRLFVPLLTFCPRPVLRLSPSPLIVDTGHPFINLCSLYACIRSFARTVFLVLAPFPYRPLHPLFLSGHMPEYHS